MQLRYNLLFFFNIKEILLPHSIWLELVFWIAMQGAQYISVTPLTAFVLQSQLSVLL